MFVEVGITRSSAYVIVDIKGVEVMDQDMEKIIQDYARDVFEVDYHLWNKDYGIGACITDILSELTLGELHDMCRTLQLEGLRSLTESEIEQRLASEMVLALKDNLACFDDERYEIISIAARKGYITVGEEFEAFKAEYFLNWGILFPTRIDGKKALVFPTELREVFNSIDGVRLEKVIYNNTEVARVFHGLIYYYGIYDMEQTMKHVIHLVGEIITPLHSVINAAVDYYNLVSIWDGKFFYYMLQEPDRLMELIQKRYDVEYYPFTKEELMVAGEEHFQESSNYTDAYLNFIMDNFYLSQEEGETLVVRLLMNIKNGWDFNIIMRIQDEVFELPDKQSYREFVRIVYRVYCSTHLWKLKGHTLLELEAASTYNGKSNVIDFNSKKEEGTINSCPCGSGKRLKKCCGI